MEKIKVFIDAKNDRRYSYVGIVYAALLMNEQAEQAQAFLDEIDMEDDLEPYDGINLYTLIDICRKYVDLDVDAEWYHSWTLFKNEGV